MKIDDLIYLARAGYNKEEIAKLLKDDSAPADPKPEDPKPADPKPADPKPADPKPAQQSEIEFLRKQVQDLQALNLMFASGKPPVVPESEEDIMRILLNGKE